MVVARADPGMTDSLAARTREAVRSEPFLLEALSAGVVNYTAAARHLEVEGDEEAVATALRRFAGDIERTTERRDVRVTMESGVGAAGTDESHLLSVGATGVDSGEGTALLATGDVDARALAAALRRLTDDGVGVEAAGIGGDTLVVVVDRRDGADALRTLEAAFDAVSHVE